MTIEQTAHLGLLLLCLGAAAFVYIFPNLRRRIRYWLIVKLAAGDSIAVNLTVHDGGFIIDGRNGFFSGCRVTGARGTGVTHKVRRKP